MEPKDFTDLLHSRGLKATSSRLNLLLAMHKYASAMPYSAIQKALYPIDRVTLYRTIESLNEKAVIHKAYQENNEIYYAICGKTCKKNHHHHDHIHFKCIKCETVSCEHPTENMNFSIPGYEIQKVAVYLEGICKHCKE